MWVMLKHLPFASVDSSSWVQYAKNGQILIPIYGANGHPDYSLRPDKITVSNRGRARLRRDHIDRVDSFRRQRAERFLHKVGVTLQEVGTSKPARMQVCIKVFLELAVHTGTPLFFVTNLDNEQRQVLSQGGAATRLLSYAELQNKRASALADYARRENQLAEAVA